MSKLAVVLCALGVIVWGVGPAWGWVPQPAEPAAETPPADVELDPAVEPAPECGDCGEGQDCCCDCPLRTIVRGEVSGYRLGDRDFRGLNALIRDRETWARFWRLHTANLQPPPPLPPVDFQRSAVLVALLGTRTTGGGPAIQIVRSVRCNATTIVHVAIDNRPGPLPVITNPFHIAEIPAWCVAPVGSIAFVSNAPAAVPGALVGRVLAAQRPNVPPAPLPGANVRLAKPGQPPMVVAQTRTGPEGFFRFPEVPPGSYQLIASADGYIPLAKPVQVRPGATLQVDFVLNPQPTTPEAESMEEPSVE